MSNEKKWWYTQGSDKFGPFTRDEFKALAAHGRIQPSTLVWKEGSAHWLPAADVSGLFTGTPPAMPPLPIEVGKAARGRTLGLAVAAILVVATIVAVIAYLRYSDSARASPATEGNAVPAGQAQPTSLLTMPTTSPVAGSAPVEILSNDDITKQVMEENYGTRYLADKKCWLVTFSDTTYCMALASVKEIDANGEKRLYVLADGFPADDKGENNGGHASSGVVGAFIGKRTEAGGFEYLAGTKEMEYGSNGISGASEAKLVMVGPNNYYGWVFTSGGMFQGIIVSSFNILAPKGDRIVDLSAIPEYREEDQSVHYKISFDTQATGQKVFPLRIAVLNEAAKTIKSGRSSFDYRSWTYRLPAELMTAPTQKTDDGPPADTIPESTTGGAAVPSTN